MTSSSTFAVTTSELPSGRVIIVTGGGSGIGRAAALGFAEQGAQVLITGRRAEPLDDTAAAHPNITPLVADAAGADDARRTISTAVERWGRIDALINNAGAGAILPLAEVTADRIRQIFAVNVVGPSLLAAAALPHLAASRGVIVNVSSTFGHKPGAGLSHYAASKAALEHLTRCWALEFAPSGIRVNAVAAGPTETDALTGMMGLSEAQAAAVKAEERAQIPLGRRGVPEDVAAWIVQLADPSATWVTGQVLAVDGGLGLV
ncbi:SDR family NAD(P)-dependent oxidoreductase [Rhodopseudomonas palustris]|uniref:SDR family oxidoreductase n=1 Tax=Rhodopseudomonas palustris TaxID=1076 RepID=A0A418VH87_RHOPL|nr:SDR family oxidoreductase [Rhodopseudomonas palustris]RJF75488.1 SDR family oxidoreductase [Rhodopseudomonas palustris]